MKTLIIIALVIFTTNVSSNELSWVDKQIEAIKPPRSGLSNNTVSVLEDPFIFLKENKSKKKSSKNVSTKNRTSSSSNKLTAKKRSRLSLDAVINKSALINGKWYKTNEKVGSYTLSKVSLTSVVLTKKSKKLILTTNSISKNLNFKNK